MSVYRVLSDGSLQLTQCTGNTSSVFEFSVGRRYFIQVGSSFLGGTFSLTLSTPPPDLTIDLQVDRAEYNPRTGVVYLTGSVLCNQSSQYLVVDGKIRQVNHKEVLEDTFQTYIAGGCRVTRTVWTAVVSTTKPYGTGPLFVFVRANGCAPFSCGYSELNRTLNMTKTKT